MALKFLKLHKNASKELILPKHKFWRKVTNEIKKERKKEGKKEERKKEKKERRNAGSKDQRTNKQQVKEKAI